MLYFLAHNILGASDWLSFCEKFDFAKHFFEMSMRVEVALFLEKIDLCAKR
jgi:hypothetical protein